MPNSADQLNFVAREGAEKADPRHFLAERASRHCHMRSLAAGRRLG
jgi:hypothetical protein